MLKRFTSLLLCLSLLPGQALAADESAPVAPAVIVESVEPEEAEDPKEPPVMPMAEVLEEKDIDYGGLD